MKLDKARERFRQHSTKCGDVNLGQGSRRGAKAEEGQTRCSSSQRWIPVQKAAAPRSRHQARVHQQTKD